MNQQAAKQTEQLSTKKMLLFFLPLAASASLVTLSHVIINSTLARSANAEIVISAYAVAMSIFAITERPAVLLRQTCSALVRDRSTFSAMAKVTFYAILCILFIGFTISYTPAGSWIFANFFSADETLKASILQVYRILMFVTIFSAIRCLYHGVIISNMRTKWLTIGMIIRLAVMYGMSLYFIYVHGKIDGRTGAYIFLAGMVVEALVSFLEGRLLVRKLPDQKTEKTRSAAQIFQFYRPLVYSSFIAVIIGPAINAVLGRTVQFELAIASYAIALSVTQLVTSFVSYIHQIVLNFYNIDKNKVFRFTIPVSLLPALFITTMGYTPVGTWMLQYVIGVSDALLEASIDALRIFAIMSLVFPWVDFLNGLIILKGQTRIMVWSQLTNVIVTLIVLMIMIGFAPHWNGMIGALAQSLGFAGELAAAYFLLKLLSRVTPKMTQTAKLSAETDQDKSQDV